MKNVHMCYISDRRKNISEKTLMKNVHMCYISDRRKIKNLKKGGKLRISILIFIYTIPFAYLKVYTKFLNQVVAEKSLTENVHILCYIGVTEGKLKKSKMSLSIFMFIYTIHLAYLEVYTKFENTGCNRNREICGRNFNWRKRKMSK